MDEPNETAELRAEVRFLSLTLKCLFSIIFGFISLMTAELVLRADLYGSLVEDMLGGGQIPMLTQLMLDWYQVIAAVVLVGATLIIVSVFTVKARWPLILLVVSTLGCIVLHRLLLMAYILPILEIIKQLTS